MSCFVHKQSNIKSGLVFILIGLIEELCWNCLSDLCVPLYLVALMKMSEF